MTFQADSEEVVTFLISSKIIPLILRIMETGSELSQTVATFILQRIVMAEAGLMHVCQTFDRFVKIIIVFISLIAIIYFSL